MQTYSITDARKKLGELVKRARYGREVIALGNHGKAKVYLVSISLGEEAHDVTHIARAAEASGSFDFLKNEPELYTLDDAIEVYK